MCGICVHLLKNSAISAPQPCHSSMRIPDVISRRGPDAQNSVTVSTNGGKPLFLAGAVLHMRGLLCPQPIEQDGNHFLWNGELFAGLSMPPDQNDGLIILNHLCEADTDEKILNVLSQIKGPYAFVYYQHQHGKLWFGRDVFGRRSLVYYDDQKAFRLSSVALSDVGVKLGDWKELPAAGIYCLNLKSNFNMKCYPWRNSAIETNLISSMDDFDLEAGQPITAPVGLLVNQTVPSVENIPSALTDSLDSAQIWLKEECDSLLQVLGESVHRRVTDDSYFCECCIQRGQCSQAHIAIMFSGGIDSMMLTALADKHVPEGQPIDLLNVAFQSGGGDNYDVPDRITGRIGLSELNPKRQWNWYEINVTKAELQQCREQYISELILPLNTVLDDSIGCAMWFASRGSGNMTDRDGQKVYKTSNAKVVLSGLGADELLGGYSRHRGAFTQGGWVRLVEEISMDVGRISSRNLGRDDRIISDHGKEARFPFLDEDVVSMLNQLPIQKKMNLQLPRGVGEKLLLRVCAAKLGLNQTSTLAKRAIQFGSKIAKCEKRKEKGSDVCDRINQNK